MAKPLVFISHKHADKDIALTVAKWIEEATDFEMDVFLSSNESFKGPRFGKELNKELRTALWNCDVLIVIYTIEDREWSYCMWECGVANDQSSPDTTMIVFQFSDDVPKVLAGTARVDARQPGDLRKFAAQLFTDHDFFPSLNRPLKAQLPKEVIHTKADALYTALKSKEFVVKREWSTWPYVQCELAVADIDRIKQASPDAAIDIVGECATVSFCDPKALDVFGLAAWTPGTTIGALKVKDGTSAQPAWFRALCEQIAVCAAERLPQLRWAPILRGGHEFVPAVSRVRLRPESRVQFDVFFYDLPRRNLSAVASRMLTLDRFFWKNLGQGAAPDLRGGTIGSLASLNRDLKSQAKNRVPLLDASLHPKYIIHRSAITEYLAENGAKEESTLEDLLADSRQRDLVENSFATVGRDATLADAAAAMKSIPNCRDVFVTEDGTRNSAVVGWLTNVDLE